MFNCFLLRNKKLMGWNFLHGGIQVLAKSKSGQTRRSAVVRGFDTLITRAVLIPEDDRFREKIQDIC